MICWHKWQLTKEKTSRQLFMLNWRGIWIPCHQVYRRWDCEKCGAYKVREITVKGELRRVL